MCHWKMVITMHQTRIAYQSSYQHLNQCVATSVPTKLGSGTSLSEKSQGPHPFSHFSRNGRTQKPTIAPLHYFLRLQYILFTKISLSPSPHPFLQQQHCSELPSLINKNQQI
mmetsp:Transcript_29448/g.29940  ORF Transcript_29448/g.29940 Transcript_29448/m.29940 type:complete len:112 (+) Transcript_29448:54-389(+)